LLVPNAANDDVASKQGRVQPELLILLGCFVDGCASADRLSLVQSMLPSAPTNLSVPMETPSAKETVRVITEHELVHAGPVPDNQSTNHLNNYSNRLIDYSSIKHLACNKKGIDGRSPWKSPCT
jgi:hypothetical protein